MDTRKDELVELEGIKIRRSEIELIKRTIFKDATDDELALFFYEAKRRGVHPMDRMIFPVVRKDASGERHVTFQMGIDYLRAAGEETGKYVGQDPIQYGNPIKITGEKEGEEIEVPDYAEATVLRRDESGEIIKIPHRAYWKEYYPKDFKLGFMWRKMPFNQLGKCAEAGALRKAFPRKLGGLYINEEMEQAAAVPFTPIQMPKEKASEPPPAEEIIVGQITNVETKLGPADAKTKKPAWTLYNIFLGEDKFGTFDSKIMEAAKTFWQSKAMVEVTWKAVKQGKQITQITEYVEREEGPPE